MEHKRVDRSTESGGRTSRGVDDPGWGISAITAMIGVVTTGCLALSGCTFDSAAGREPCPEDKEGTVEDGAICQDGYWVPTDVGTGDAADIIDTAGSGTETGPTEDTGLESGDPSRDTCGTGGSACGDIRPACAPGATESCYPGSDETEGVGRCEAGTRTCRENGEWGDCEGATTPTEETCGDQIDNDCDGSIDENETCRCDYESTSTGVCSRGRLDGAGTCQPPDAYESSESSCEDGRDNDCDGEVDEEDDDCGDDEEQKEAGSSCEEDEECLSRCIDETCAHRVFVTSETYDGDLGGLSGGDTACDDLASGAGARGDWKAILSDTADAAEDRLDISAPIVRWDGAKVADGADDLWDSDGQLDHPIEIDERGMTTEGRVWTGTNSDGTRDGSDEAGDGQTCKDWSSSKGCRGVCISADRGEAGDSGETDARWLVGVADPTCDENHHLYCIDGQ